jgi:ribosomal-protein-alanine N-acetyltransferase
VATIETERLILRRFDAGDAAFILRLLNEPSFIENIVDKGVRSLDDARAYIESGPVASYRKHGFGLWRVALRETDLPIGMCGLIRRDVLDDVDLGYALLPEHAGCGYALEAATACVALAREQLGLSRLVAVVSAGNERSIRLLRKLGFEYERMVRLADDEEELELYARAIQLS